jgi:hypothetical protein
MSRKDTFHDIVRHALEPEYVLYLAVPMDAYTSFFATQLVQSIMHSQQLKLIVYKPEQEVIEQWLT